MGKDIQQLYDNVMSALPFSITGHIALNEKLNRFYEHLVESNFIKYNQKITILFSALLNIPINNSDEQNNTKGISDWELQNFDELFYKTFVEGDKEEALSFYFYLLEWSAEKLGLSNLTTSLVLSKFFLADLDFRVGLLKDRTSTRPNVRFDKRRNLFEINIPWVLFKINEFENLTHLKLELNKIWFGSKKGKYTIKLNQSDRIYKIKKPTNGIHFKEIFDKFIDVTKLNDIAKIIAEEYLREFAKFKLYKHDEKLFKEVAYCSICLSFLSLYYDSYIEYMLSIAKADYKFQHHSNGENVTEYMVEYRNLGGLIIGYKSETELTGEERAIFNIISDRLASVVAGQFLFLENTKYTISEHRKKRKELYTILDEISFLTIENEGIKNSLDDLLHERESVVYKENLHKPLKDFLVEHYLYFNHIYQELKEGIPFNKRKQYLMTGGSLNIYKESGLFLNKINEVNGDISVFANIPLLNKLFKIFEEDIKFEEMSWSIENTNVCLQNKIENRNKLFCKLDLKKRLENRGAGANGFLATLEQNRSALLGNGNLFIKINNEIVFDLERHTQLNKNSKLEFTKEFIQSKDFSSKTFTIEFKIMDE